MVDRLEQSAGVPVEAVLDGKCQVLECHRILRLGLVDVQGLKRVVVLFKLLDTNEKSRPTMIFGLSGFPLGRTANLLDPGNNQRFEVSVYFNRDELAVPEIQTVGFDHCMSGTARAAETVEDRAVLLGSLVDEPPNEARVFRRQERPGSAEQVGQLRLAIVVVVEDAGPDVGLDLV